LEDWEYTKRLVEWVGGAWKKEGLRKKGKRVPPDDRGILPY